MNKQQLDEVRRAELLEERHRLKALTFPYRYGYTRGPIPGHFQMMMTRLDEIDRELIHARG